MGAVLVSVIGNRQGYIDCLIAQELTELETGQARDD